MTEALDVMKWPLLACLLLPGLLVYLGLHIVRREIIFVDLALAQVAALGTCLAILLHFEPLTWQSYAFSLGFTLVGAAIFTLTRTQKHHVPQEALIGIVYVVAAALGILLLSGSPEGNEELRRTLIGDVLLVSPHQVGRTFALYVAVAVVHFIFRKKFLALSFEAEKAEARGLSVRWWDFLFYALFGWVVTSFVQIGGVLLVFSYLIVPAVCANFLASQLRWLLLIGWLTATISSMVGLFASYRLDLPTGAAIVCALGAALILTIIAAKLRDKMKKT
ncbi:MAG TPA: iron chelate uptake ABC transporter family permease subunit [Verrucomicrobiae bacterium]|nr:iron chelate uptake ABC transporter family permease subunit [Verrucomicrobiae bacterium]